MKRLLIVLILAAFAFAPTQTKATHLMGGNFCYTYIRSIDSTEEVVYFIEAWVYRDRAGIAAPTSLTNTRIYLNDGPPHTLFRTITLPRISQINLPELGNECGFVCVGCTRVEEDYYADTITLPMSLGGYHFVWQSCCRNWRILNLVSGGTTHYAFIPPTYFENSSPCFTDIPVPVICKGDEVCMSNSALDVDGDLLVFNFANPWKSTPTSPPFDDENYKPGGYSDSIPFGPDSESSINGITGLTCFTAPEEGNFVFALDVQEYRKGFLLSSVRRDLQVLVTTCPPQARPEFFNIDTATLGTIVKTSYIIEEGETLDFDINIRDDDGDFMQYSMRPVFIDFFDPAVMLPDSPAHLIDSTAGTALITTKFHWETNCGMGSEQPFTFLVSVVDSGCPSKEALKIFAIYVTPTIFPPGEIDGENYICMDQLAQYFSTDTDTDYTYNWMVDIGSIVGANDQEDVWIQWPNTASLATITLIRTKFCLSDTITLLVNVAADGLIQLEDDVEMTICQGESIPLVEPFFGSFTYSWDPTDGLSNAGINNPIANPDTTTLYTVTVSQGSCEGTRRFLVNVIPAPVLSGQDDTSCIGGVVRLSIYGSDSVTWTPATGLSDPTVTQPFATPEETTTYTVTGVDENGCVSKPVNITVVIIEHPDDFNIVPDSATIKLGGSVGLTAWYQNSFTTYQWNPPDDPPSLSCYDCPNPTASPLVTTGYWVNIVTDKGCLYTDSVIVYVQSDIQIPNIFTPNGDGINDLISVFGGIGTIDFEFKIFDRWGKIVYNSVRVDESWDGSYKGKIQPMDTYAYYIKAVYATGDPPVVLNGHITLVK